MSQNYTTYLAANVLNEGEIVTYRSLSRALKVHSNVAKRMLYDFHHKQNAKRPGSVHATYLVSGVQAGKSESKGVQKKDEDVHMQSSPFMSSSMPNQDEEEPQSQPGMRVITLTREEHLEEVKAKYESIISIHIYSLEQNTIKNLQVLSDVKREITTKYADEDPLKVGQQYGTICNPHVRRRTGGRPVLPMPSTSASKAKPEPLAKAPAVKPAPKTENQPQIKAETKQPQIKAEPKQEPTKLPPRKPPPMKKEISDMFKSFAKPKPKPKPETTESSVEKTPPPGTPQSETASGPPDEPMHDAPLSSSSDDDEDAVLALSKPKSTNPKEETARFERLAREARLRKLMEDDDDDGDSAMSDAPPPKAESPEIEDSQPEESQEVEPVAPAGRRRGKRKVLKKKTLKDEEGYLVTREEVEWESFSEDEPAPQKKKEKVEVVVKDVAPKKESGGGGGGKKEGKKGGQQGIMGFFGKK